MGAWGGHYVCFKTSQFLEFELNIKGIMKVDARLRLIICYFVIPAIKLIVRHIEPEIKQSKNPYDDMALELIKLFIDRVSVLICEGGNEKVKEVS